MLEFSTEDINDIVEMTLDYYRHNAEDLNKYTQNLMFDDDREYFRKSMFNKFDSILNRQLRSVQNEVR